MQGEHQVRAKPRQEIASLGLILLEFEDIPPTSLVLAFNVI
jgi:hypothetical protein